MTPGLYVLGTLPPGAEAAWSRAVRALASAAWATVHPVPAETLPPGDAALLYDAGAGLLLLAPAAVPLLLPVFQALPPGFWTDLALSAEPLLNHLQSRAPALPLPEPSAELVRELVQAAGWPPSQLPFAQGVITLVHAYLQSGGRS